MRERDYSDEEPTIPTRCACGSELEEVEILRGDQRVGTALVCFECNEVAARFEDKR